MNFSICIIGRNEEKTLPRMLASLKTFKDLGGEIIYVDTGSTDGTVEVAKEMCKVYEEGDRFITIIDKKLAKSINGFFGADVVKDGEKLFDYSEARNYASSLASNDMVAMPDCDETYTSLNLDKIQEVIENGTEQLEYNFVFSHDEFGREAIKFRHCKFYNRTKLKWKGMVHEVLDGNAKKEYLGEEYIKLEHYQNHDTDRSGYIVGLALDCYLHQDNDRNSHYLGRELLWKGHTEAAIKELKRHLEISWWDAERGQSMIYIGKAYETLKDEKQAVEWWHRSISEYSGRREAYMTLADYYFKKSDPQRTACYVGAALQILDNGFYANNMAYYKEVPHELMYWAMWELGNKAESKHHHAMAMRYAPLKDKILFDARYYYDLPLVSIVLPTLERPKGLKKALKSIDGLIYPKDKIETIVIEDKPRKGVPKRVAEGLKKSKGEVVCYASNDIEFDKGAMILAVLEMLRSGKKLVSFNTGEYTDDGNICEHFIIHKDLVKEVGEIFDTEFYHVGVDKLLWEQCKKLDQATLCRNAKVVHNHFSRLGSGIEKDKVNELGWKNVEKDRKLLEKKLKKLTL